MQVAELQSEVAELKFDRSKWKPRKFGDVVACVDKTCRNPTEVGLSRIVGLDNLDPGELKIKRWGDVDDGTSFTRSFRSGQVLFGKRRAYQRKVALANFDGICSGDILVFESRGNGLLPQLLPFLVQSEAFFAHALGTSAGSLSPRTKWKEIAKWEFLLPCEDDQLRITRVLTACDIAIELELESVNQAQQVYDAKSTVLFGSSGSTELKVAEYLDRGGIKLLTGPFGTVLSAKEYVAHGVPVLNPSHMKNSGFDLTVGPYVSEETAKRLTRYRLQLNDIVLSRKGEMGKASVVTDDSVGAILGSDCISVRLNDSQLSPEFIVGLLCSQAMRRWLESYSQGSTLPGINEKTIRSMPFSVPSHERQTEIVRELSEFLVTRIQMENLVAKTRRMRSTILRNVWGEVA